MNRPDFDTIINRRGTGSYKWDDQPAAPADTLHLWVADMDFRCAEPITNALQRRVEHGIFGYTYVSDDYYDAVTDWFSARHGWNIDRGSIIYTSGVVPAISAIIKAMTHPGDMVITQTPAYNCFFSSTVTTTVCWLRIRLSMTTDAIQSTLNALRNWPPTLAAGFCFSAILTTHRDAFGLPTN